jgi:hypothetical protein
MVTICTSGSLDLKKILDLKKSPILKQPQFFKKKDDAPGRRYAHRLYLRGYPSRDLNIGLWGK